MRTRRGFTLVELLVTLAVTGIFVALLYQVFISFQRSYRVQDELAEAQQNARVAMDELTRALASIGAGTAVEAGQPRLLVAHEHEITFTADLSPDHDAQPPGDPVPGAGAQDPLPAFPAGAYAGAPAETYRYGLKRDPDTGLYTLYREVNGGADQAVAMLLANPRRDVPLFRYYGDFDGDGTSEWLDRVDRATSPRVAAGEALATIVRRIAVQVVTETARPDPRYPLNDGHRQVRLVSSVAPRNLWDCPIVSATPPTDRFLRAPDLRGAETELAFRVTRGGQPEAGRTLVLTLDGPPGHGATVQDAGGTGPSAVTDASGTARVKVVWPADCADLPEGTYTVTARTAEPPSLQTPFGACPPYEARIRLHVGPGYPASVSFSDTRIEARSCGGEAATTYRVLDGCGRQVRAEDVAARPVDLEIGPDPEFGTLIPARLGEPGGTVTYRSRTGRYASYGVSRSPADPNRFLAWIQPVGLAGRVDVEVYLEPDRVVDLTANIATAAYTDCPDPTTPVTDTFGVEDACGNPLWTLSGTGESVRLELVPQPGPGTTPDQGGVASPGNRAAFSADPVDITVAAGTSPGEFLVQYRAPTCTVGGLPYRPLVRLVPSWDPSRVRTLPVALAPCTGCSVRVENAAGVPVTRLNRECDAESFVVITQCVPTGTTVEVVIEPEPGSRGAPSFDRNRPRDRVTVTFGAATAGQTARIPLYIGTAQSGDAFRVTAHIPDRATAAALGGVTCSSETVAVDTTCSEILISPVPDNPGGVPSTPSAQDTPLCAVEGGEVFFRIRDCDQNERDYAADDIVRTAGSTRGLLVEVLDADGTVLDTESPDLFEVDVHGNPATDSPYFQGRLAITQDPDDPPFSGLLKAPVDREAVVRARYVDPDDPLDRDCVAEALLVPPVPVCLLHPVQVFGNWEGGLEVHGGDAAVAGDLVLPAAPLLIGKTPTSPLAGGRGEDRFFNAYVGGTIRVGGAELTPPGPLDRPFVPGGSGAFVSEDHPNYLQAVPDVPGLMTRLDYARLKALARIRGVYWEPVGGGMLRNPLTGATGTFQEITALPGPGTGTATHDGRFLFVDAPAGLRSGSAIDQAPLEDLPVYVVSGRYYTEGLIYVAGTVEFRSPGPAATVSLMVPAPLDARYDEATARLTRDDLPLGPVPGSDPVGAGTIPVHGQGALYADGEIRLLGPVRWYGVLSAERGVRNPGGAAVWYDPRWAQSLPELCTRCCRITVDPPAPRLAPGDTLTLGAPGAAGAVVWESLAPAVARVDPSGLLEALAEGTAVVRATDAAGCVAETEVRVACDLRVVADPSTDLLPGDTAMVVASGLRGTPHWTPEDPSVVAIVRDFGPSVLVEARGIGAARIVALDVNGCEAGVDLSVGCPDAVLAADPADPLPNDTVTLRVYAGPEDLTDRFAFAAGGTALAGPTYVVPDLSAVAFQAHMPHTPCTAGPLEVTPRCPEARVRISPILRVGIRSKARVVDADGRDWTGSYILSVRPADAARVEGSEIVPLRPGRLLVEGRWDRCGAAPAETTVLPLPGEP